MKFWRAKKYVRKPESNFIIGKNKNRIITCNVLARSRPTANELVYQVTLVLPPKMLHVFEFDNAFTRNTTIIEVYQRTQFRSQKWRAQGYILKVSYILWSA